MQDVLSQLAFSSGIRNEAPNKALAEKIVAERDTHAIKVLIENIHNNNRNIRGDIIKTLYEIGVREPNLIAEYSKVFISLLKHKDNRMVWGAMCALDSIASVRQTELYTKLPEIISAAEKGTVITRDHSVGVMIQIAQNKKYYLKVIHLLFEVLRFSPDNQFPTYAKRISAIVKKKDVEEFVSILRERILRIESETKRKRLQLLLKKIESVAG